MADTSKPASGAASAATTEASSVPGFREQTSQAYTVVKETIVDKEKRAAALEQAKGAVAQGVAVAKETLTTPEGRQALLDQTKAVVSETASHLTDAEKRAALLQSTKESVAYAAQGVKDPAVRQDLHNRAAAASHSVLASAGLVPGGATTGTAGATGVPASDLASAFPPVSMPTSTIAHDMPGPTPTAGLNAAGMPQVPAGSMYPTGSAVVTPPVPAGSVYPLGGTTAAAAADTKPKEHMS